MNPCQQSRTLPSPRVSWLLCTNAEDALLHRAIRSCLTQTVTDFELVLITNGPDAARLAYSLSQQYGKDRRVRIIETPIRLLNFSLSLGVHHARAPFIARMDADDIAHVERLERQLVFMEANPEVVVLGSSYELIDAQGRRTGQIKLPLSDAAIRSALRFRNPICHPSVMLRRDAVIAVGGYLGGRNAEDYDLWLRLSSNTAWKFANLPDPLLSYNRAPSGQARRSRSAYANVAAAQVRQFLVSRDVRWLAGAILTAAKCAVRSNRE